MVARGNTARVNMGLHAVLYLALCFASQLNPAQSFNHEQGGHSLRRRFAEIGGMRYDPSLRMLWHVGVYSKAYAPYMQICGGTLVTTRAVISAAHCFWSEKGGALPAEDFAIGAGKKYRPWIEPKDYDGQQADVAEIHIPVRYRHAAASYQEDIAVVVVAEAFVVNDIAVRPACVNFDKHFDDEQLAAGEKGTILGWGLTAEDGPPSQVLNYLKLPAVDIEECMASADPGFLRYITSDKICAGVTTGQALCRGDSGGGLVFSQHTGGASVHFLRAVASTAPRNEHECNAHALAALTHVRAHRDFLQRHIPDLEAECEKHYLGAAGLLARPGSSSDRQRDSDTEQPVNPVVQRLLHMNCEIFKLFQC